MGWWGVFNSVSSIYNTNVKYWISFWPSSLPQKLFRFERGVGLVVDQTLHADSMYSSNEALKIYDWQGFYRIRERFFMEACKHKMRLLSHIHKHGRNKEGTLSTCYFQKDLQPIRMRDATRCHQKVAWRSIVTMFITF